RSRHETGVEPLPRATAKGNSAAVAGNGQASGGAVETGGAFAAGAAQLRELQRHAATSRCPPRPPDSRFRHPLKPTAASTPKSSLHEVSRLRIRIPSRVPPFRNFLHSVRSIQRREACSPSPEKQKSWRGPPRTGHNLVRRYTRIVGEFCDETPADSCCLAEKPRTGRRQRGQRCLRPRAAAPLR